MNEQIKKLTIQALAKCDATKMTQLSSSVDNGNGVDIPLEFSEKFAELIVNECCDWIDGSPANDAGFRQGQSEEEVMKSVNGALAVLDGIVAKFGVES
jgi:hypothetical protein